MRFRVKQLAVLSACLAATAACAASEAGGSCHATAPAVKNSTVDVPNYAAQPDDSPDPQAEAAQRAWSRYRDSMIAMLKSSPDPRDWALASFGFSMGSSIDDDLADRVFLERAVKAAPDDPLVLWMAISVNKKARNTSNVDTLIDKLQQAEPNNAAVWLESLQRSAVNRDRAEVSAALKRMSATSHFDNHLAEMNKLIVAAFERLPIPDDTFEAIPAEARPSRELMPLIYGTAMANAIALPAFQYVVNACRLDASGRNADRVADCDLVGHLMKSNSDTQIGTSIGFAVLRVSQTFTEDDVREARDLDWVYEQWNQHAAKQFDEHAAMSDPSVGKEIAERENDWLESGSEVESMRQALRRANVALTAPDDWVDKSQRFSHEQMATDATYLTDHAIAY
jgi:hypothetical protein